MADKNAHAPAPEAESREATVTDLVRLCSELNRRHAKDIVIGGFAMRAAGCLRSNMAVDFLVDVSLENERRILTAVATLPERAANQVPPGESAQWVVVRIGDEITVGLRRSGCGIDYQKAAAFSETYRVDGVQIPFASPHLLWLTKKATRRIKDLDDLLFLREWFASHGKEPYPVE